MKTFPVLLMIRIAIFIYLVASTSLYVRAQAPLSADNLSTCPEGHSNLAAIIACAPKLLGPAPYKFDTAFLVESVSPIGGGSCSMNLVTNGMAYYVTGDNDAGWCNHLPPLHSLVWGRVRHSKLATFLRQSNTVNVESDYVDLVYSGSSKPKSAPYIISGSNAIGPDYGGGIPEPTGITEVRAAVSDPTVKNQLIENSKSSQGSQAAAASLLAEGHVPTQEELQQRVKDGKASTCAVLTTPAGADVYIDGNLAGKTPIVFILIKREHPRTLVIKMDGYESNEQTFIPDGKDIPVVVTLTKRVPIEVQ